MRVKTENVASCKTPTHIAEKFLLQINPKGGKASSLNGYRYTGRKVASTATPGFGYRLLTPTALTAQKGILITQSDNLQYTRGSLQGGDGSGVVYENFDPNAGSLEFWIRPNFASNDTGTYFIFANKGTGATTNRITLYFANGVLKLDIFGSSSVNRGASITAPSWSAGDWVYVIGRWDRNNAVSGSYRAILGAGKTSLTSSTNGSTVTWSHTAIGTMCFIGQDATPANRFNGVIAGGVLNRPLTDTQRTANFASGAGHTNTFTVTPDTVAMFAFSDNSTNMVFHHRGQRVSAISNGATESALTLGQAVGSRSWANNDRVAVWDGTGYKKEGLIDEPSIATTDTTLDVDNGSGALVTDIEKVGVYADLDGDSQTFYKTDDANLSITGDMTISVWVKTSSTNAGGIAYKWSESDNKRSYAFQIDRDGKLRIIISDDGTNIEYKTGTDTVNDGKWHHVALVYDNTANTVDFYINGYADSGGTQTFTSETGAINDNDSEFSIGAKKQDGGTYFNGGIRDVQIWNNSKATAAEILLMAANPLTEGTAATNAPTAWWPLTDASGSATISDDSSAGNSLDLTPYDGGDVTYTSANIGRTQTAFISKNLIADAGMENGGIGGWSDLGTVAALATFAKNTTTVNRDTRSLRLTVAAGGGADDGISQTITTANTEKYLIRGYYKVASGDTWNLNITNGGGDIATLDQTSWTEFKVVFTATGAITINFHATAASDDIYLDQLQLLPLIAGDSLTATKYYTLIYDTDLASTGYLWTGLGSDATEVQAGDLYAALDQDDPATTGATTPSTSANSFGTGKWNELLGSYLIDGLDTVTFSSAHVPTSNGTIAFWAKIRSPYTTGDDKVFFDVRGADNNNRIKIYYQASTDKFVSYINGADRLLSSAQTDNTYFYTWVHVALTYDFTKDLYALYINGSSVATATTSLTAPSFGGNNAFLGSDYNSSSQGDAFIDEFRIYGFTMSARQVKELYWEVE